jgi:hypothetical protein
MKFKTQKVFNAFHDCNEMLLQDDIENIILALDKQGLKIVDKTYDIFTIGNYELSNFHDGDYWLSNEIGEGMQVKKNDLEKLIDDFFKNNF